MSAQALEYTATATTKSMAVSGIGGQGADATAIVSGVVDAHVGTTMGTTAPASPASIDAGTVTITANAQKMSAVALADSAAVSLANVTVMIPSATVSGAVRAYVGEGVTLHATSLTVTATALNSVP